MIDFSDSPPRRRGEGVLPMINVVFLLLIFFLMTATLAPPEPFEIVLPTAEGANTDADDLVLYMSADAELAFGTTRGPDVYRELAAHGGDGNNMLTLRAAGGVEAVMAAAVLERLARIGFTRVEIVSEPP